MNMLVTLALLLPVFGRAETPTFFSEKFPVVDYDNSAPVIAKEVLQTYADSLNAETPNPVQSRISALRKQVGDGGTVDLPSAEDLMLDSSSFIRRPNLWGGTYVLGVPVFEKGTGQAKSHPVYLKVEFITEWNDETQSESVVISIKGFVKLSGN